MREQDLGETVRVKATASHHCGAPIMATWTLSPSSGTDATDDTGMAPGPELAAARAAEEGTAASAPVSDHPLGPDAVAILATEHWSLIAARSLLWNEAYSRTTIFLGALSAATGPAASRP